jgi:hypothetical protein
MKLRDGFCVTRLRCPIFDHDAPLPPNGHGAQLRAARGKEGYIRRAAGESTSGPGRPPAGNPGKPRGGGASAAAPC